MIPLNYCKEVFGENLIGNTNGYVLPHPFDRPPQIEAYCNILKSDKPFTILKLPTGIGKTAILAELGRYLRIMSVTQKKSLQEVNYEAIYNFVALYGQDSYPCGYNTNYTTGTCSLPYAKLSRETGESKKQIFEAKCKRACAYHKKLKKAQESTHVSINYAKLYTDRNQEFNNPKVIGFDEGHELPDITINYAGCTVKWDNDFVKMKPVHMADNPTVGIKTLEKVINTIAINQPIAQNENESDSPAFKKKYKAWDRLYSKLKNTLSYVLTDIEDDNLWFFYGDQEKLEIRPKSARFHFKKLLCYRRAKYIIMSATIDENIAAELGLAPDEYDFYEIDNPYPPIMRPILDLGCPRMSNKSSVIDEVEQARKISTLAKEHPSKSTVVLTSSKAKAKDLAKRLNSFGIKTFVPPIFASTDKQILAWEVARQPGLVCISWSFWEGVNLDKDGIIVLAKVPYPSFGDPFEMARMKYDRKEFNRRVATIFVQGAGRNRRGKKEHYYPRGTQIVAIADGNWTRLGKALPDDFKGCIIKKQTITGGIS